jgi:dihydroorotase
LRTKADQEALIEGLVDGTIDAIATDHAPHAPHEKDREFAIAPFGMLGLETSLALIITHLVKPGILSLSQVIDKMSTAPARIIGVPGGSLTLGQQADITIFDPDETWTVDPTKFKSKSRNTVFAGTELTGRPTLTIVGGRIINL